MTVTITPRAAIFKIENTPLLCLKKQKDKKPAKKGDNENIVGNVNNPKKVTIAAIKAADAADRNTQSISV